MSCGDRESDVRRARRRRIRTLHGQCLCAVEGYCLRASPGWSIDARRNASAALALAIARSPLHVVARVDLDASGTRLVAVGEDGARLHLPLREALESPAVATIRRLEALWMNGDGAARDGA